MEANINLCKGIQENDLGTVLESLKLNADPHARIDWKEYFTPWNWAFSCQNYLIMLELLENEKYKADPNYPMPELCGMTAVFGAIMYGNKDIIQLLVNKGADLNVSDDEGETPLYFAISLENRLELVPFLLELGADITHGAHEIEKLKKTKPQNVHKFYDYLLEFLKNIEESFDFELLRIQVDRAYKLHEKYHLPSELVQKMEELREYDHLEEDEYDLSSKDLEGETEKSFKENPDVNLAQETSNNDEVEKKELELKVSGQTDKSKEFIDFYARNVPKLLYDEIFSLIEQRTSKLEKITEGLMPIDHYSMLKTLKIEVLKAESAFEETESPSFQSASIEQKLREMKEIFEYHAPAQTDISLQESIQFSKNERIFSELETVKMSQKNMNSPLKKITDEKKLESGQKQYKLILISVSENRYEPGVCPNPSFCYYETAKVVI